MALRQRLVQDAALLQGLAAAVAELDVLASLAEVAALYDYTRPVVEDSSQLVVRQGRHPVVERMLDGFVPNDLALDRDTHRLLLLTGPNMAGKSTYLRQAALLAILAQMGSFVPAAAATIGLVDRVFTRVGAVDDIAAGRSTFLVEMSETAHILHNATARSVLILDEIGKGTSTFEGLSIAWGGHYIVQRLGTGAVCHPLPRTHGAGSALPHGAELPHGGAETPEGIGVFAPGVAWRCEQELRLARGAPGRVTGRSAHGSGAGAHVPRKVPPPWQTRLPRRTAREWPRQGCHAGARPVTARLHHHPCTP